MPFFEMRKMIDEFEKFTKIAIKDIDIYDSPDDFYNIISDNFKNAQKVLCLTLSFGMQEKGKALLDLIKIRKQQKKETFIVVDRNRVDRTANFRNYLIENDIIDLFHFYKSSNCNYLPKYLQEILSVLHSKIYIFDDKVLLTGANLDESYFVDRWDRYFLITDQNLSYYLQHEIFYKISKDKTHLSLIPRIMNPYQEADTILIKFERENEIEILEKILKFNLNNITIMTAYLNLTEGHYNIFKDRKIKIVTGSPEASTFRLNTTCQKYINKKYIISSINTIKRLPNAIYHEFKREDSTFHCKGFWAFEDDYAVTIIGSTNFNKRSIYKDVETNFLIITRNKQLVSSFNDEIENIMHYCSIKSLEEVQSRKIGVISRILHFFCDNHF